jgi:D-beta-D-heptose 7-phosphate kinase/D-beta-D-heptose 1-phosphate adenosyltransferase
MTTHALLNQVENLASVRLLVIGDLIVDHYIRGTTERTSPEAPVPVVLFQREERVPGGAANVARNILALGASVICVGTVGMDDPGTHLIESLSRLGADVSSIVRIAGRPTTTKVRIISQSQQMLRLDYEDAGVVPSATEQQVISAFDENVSRCSGVLISDYAKGVLTHRVLKHVLDKSARLAIPVFVDPKGRDYSKYAGAYCLTPNAREAYEATGVSGNSGEELAQAAEAIRSRAHAELIVITRGAEGIALCQRDSQPVLIPAAAREVFDVTGAGDTFISVLSLGIAAGTDALSAASLANIAAGIVVGKSGAATVAPAEILSAVQPDSLRRKLRSPDELATLGETLRAEGKRIVFTNGCFDFVHVGHIAFLQQARALGDVLVLATNTDSMITRLKGAPRPIIRQAQREKLLAAIEAVDYIVAFGDETPHRLIEALRPDILVKGSNFTLDQVEGHEMVLAYGGRVELLPGIEDISTDVLLAGKRLHDQD